jgi:hypothetical protein
MPTGPKRTSRTPAKAEPEPTSGNGAATEQAPKPQPSGPRRVKKKGRAKR